MNLNLSIFFCSQNSYIEIHISDCKNKTKDTAASKFWLLNFKVGPRSVITRVSMNCIIVGEWCKWSMDAGLFGRARGERWRVCSSAGPKVAGRVERASCGPEWPWFWPPRGRTHIHIFIENILSHGAARGSRSKFCQLVKNTPPQKKKCLCIIAVWSTFPCGILLSSHLLSI